MDRLTTRWRRKNDYLKNGHKASTRDSSLGNKRCLESQVYMEFVEMVIRCIGPSEFWKKKACVEKSSLRKFMTVLKKNGSSAAPEVRPDVF